MLGQSARAQYSGGGWTAQPNPQHPSLYDWNGLTETATYTPGQTFTTPVYGGVSPSSMGTSNGVSEYTLLVNGTSTYYWLWSPPASDAGAPAPPLYALVSNSATAGVGVRSSNTDGLSATVYMNTGTGHATLPCSAPPFPANWSLLERQVVAAQSSGSSAWVPVSPSLSADLKSTLPTGSQMMGGYQVTEGVFPIVLTSPYPLGRPDLGDGSNQYTYDGQQPDGFLTVPASTNAVGAVTADTAFAKPHVGLFPSPAMQSGAVTFQWLNSGSSMYVYTPGSYPAPNGTSYPSNAFIYKGLPPDNSYFGNHVMTMMIDNNTSQTANYQLFFNSTANNFPGAAGSFGFGADTSPNWYHYYNLLYTATGQYDPESSQPAQNRASYTDPNGSTTGGHDIHVADDVVSHSGIHNAVVTASFANTAATYDEPVFMIANPSDTRKSTFVRFAGWLTVPGIFDYVYTCAHEKGHQDAYYDGFMLLNYTADQDRISDDWEDHHHMNSASPDTTIPAPGQPGVYGSIAANGHLNNGTGDIPDEEVVADTAGPASEVMNNFSKWSQDWADSGLQHGNPYYLQPDPFTHAPPSGFYLWFTPALSGNPNNLGIPYHVTSLNDIKVNHPDYAANPNMQIVTYWTQMYNANPQ